MYVEYAQRTGLSAVFMSLISDAHDHQQRVQSACKLQDICTMPLLLPIHGIFFIDSRRLGAICVFVILFSHGP